jgi:hypothetical protein
VPGARPIPKSIRPGKSASSVWNTSATCNGAWFGNMTPPDPIRMDVVAAATCAIKISGAELATLAIPWCSANQ